MAFREIFRSSVNNTRISDEINLLRSCTGDGELWLQVHDYDGESLANVFISKEVVYKLRNVLNKEYPEQ